ncbi:hypothetical protein T4A_12020 [Trichinella pseudospiralis]|uniref:Uncharacterized protein n=1 Tax=Trichinella pseudospiralis TaxID=6337 RepID=A0A0V1DYQ0_TRIPS|nr:hypothetical protein T4A_12020 [Trichinella pseudospiralis]
MVVLHNRGRNQYAQEQPRFDDVALDERLNSVYPAPYGAGAALDC